MPCIVRLRRDCCPEITRVGSAFPLANLANAEILGSLDSDFAKRKALCDEATQKPKDRAACYRGAVVT